MWWIWPAQVLLPPRCSTLEDFQWFMPATWSSFSACISPMQRQATQLLSLGDIIFKNWKQVAEFYLNWSERKLASSVFLVVHSPPVAALDATLLHLVVKRSLLGVALLSEYSTLNALEALQSFFSITWISNSPNGGKLIFSFLHFLCAFCFYFCRFDRSKASMGHFKHT